MKHTALLLGLRVHGAPEGTTITSGQAPLPILSRAFDDAFMLMAGMTVVGILLSLFLRDRVLEDLRNKPKEAEAGALQLEPAD